VPPPRSAPVHASTAAALQRAPSAIRFSRSACFALKRAFLAARSLASFARSLRVKPPGSLSFLSQATCGAPFYVYSATYFGLATVGFRFSRACSGVETDRKNVRQRQTHRQSLSRHDRCCAR
jgi:hypothetical protein